MFFYVEAVKRKTVMRFASRVLVIVNARSHGLTAHSVANMDRT